MKDIIDVNADGNCIRDRRVHEKPENGSQCSDILCSLISFAKCKVLHGNVEIRYKCVFIYFEKYISKLKMIFIERN